MHRFGEFLLGQGVITEHELEEAVRFQLVYGGRMGTVLADLAYLDVEELARHLSEFHSVPLPPREWVESPDPKALNVVPTPLMRRCKLLPLKLEPSRVHVAMIDPCSAEHLEFVRIAAQREVVPYVLPERKILYWLESHFGIDRHPRFLGMITRPRGRGITAEEAESSTPLAHGGAAREAIREKRGAADPVDEVLHASEAEPARMSWEFEEAAAGPPEREAMSSEILLLDELVSDASADDTSALPLVPTSVDGGSRDTSSHIASLEAQLHGSSTRDEIVRLGLEIARAYSRATALFVVRRDQVSGFRADGEGMDPMLADIELPLTAVSIFTHPAQTRMPFRGSPPTDGLDGRLMESLGRPEVQEVFVHPVIIRDRTVNLLYADNGPDAFGETSIAALTALCDCLSRAYERLITERKKQAPGAARC